ncbi:AAA family ATPase [Candidatus Woesearchaeota archaeon]|nr:AAA family ATPase [Candidatus Woesearchaeota archaeon]
MKQAKIIGIVSYKGGVGKTTFTTNLAIVLTQEYKKNVLVVDGSIGCPTLGLHFGYQEPDRTLQDCLNSKFLTIKDIIYEHKSGLHLIAASHSKKVQSFGSFKPMIRSLRRYYDFILIDSSPIIGEETYAVMKASDFLFVVTNTDHVSLGSSMRTIKSALNKGINIKGVILNKVLNKRFELDFATIEDATKLPILLSINYDMDFIKALGEGMPLGLYNPRNSEIKKHKQLASALCGNLSEKPMNKESINRVILNFKS